MRLTKPGTDQSLTLTLHANHEPCKEYTLPPSHPSAPFASPSVAEVFVPVPDNATLTLTGSFSGTVLSFRLDVLADGSFVVDRCVEGNKEGKVKYWEGRKVEMKSFLHVPEPSMAARGRKAKVVEGELVVKHLSQSERRKLRAMGEEGGEGTQLGVGSLAVVVSLNQRSWETYGQDSVPAYPTNTLGSWRHIPSSETRDSGIEPEHELHLDVFPDSDPVREKKANAFWRSYTSSRFGEGPWATIVFYYRYKEAIEKAGCVPFKGTFELPPHEGYFQAAGTAPEVKKEKKVLGIGRQLVLPPTPTGSAPVVPSKRRREEDEDDFASLVGNYHQSAAQSEGPVTRRRGGVSAQGSLTVPATGLKTLEIGPSSGGYDNSHDDYEDLFDPPSALPIPSMPTPVFQPKPAPSTSSKRSASPTPSTPGSAIRLASPASTPSTASSPAKRAKIGESADFSARKAALLASITAKRERKAAAQAKLEAEKTAREEQRKAWEAEEARKLKERAEEEEEQERMREEGRLRAEEEEEELARLEKEAEEEDEEIGLLEAEGEKGRMEWEAEVEERRC